MLLYVVVIAAICFFIYNHVTSNKKEINDLKADMGALLQIVEETPSSAPAKPVAQQQIHKAPPYRNGPRPQEHASASGPNADPRGRPGQQPPLQQAPQQAPQNLIPPPAAANGGSGVTLAQLQSGENPLKNFFS